MLSTTPSFALVLEPYKKFIEQRLQDTIQEQFGSKTPLRDACEYALLNGGKRFRPALVLMIAKALGYGIDVFPAALGIEFFHTASLIADDLPCMDNDDERRKKPTLHKVHGESVALLSTYALISAGYGCLAKNAEQIKESCHPHASQSDRLCVLALENVVENTGILGATGGQFLDLTPPNLTLSVLLEVIHKKTVTLFEISFVLGWIFGGGELSLLPLVKKSAYHFGMAFQIADDIGDMAQDQAHDHALNIANVCGKENALRMFHEEMEHFEQTLAGLNLGDSDLQVLAQLLVSQVTEGL